MEKTQVIEKYVQYDYTIDIQKKKSHMLNSMYYIEHIYMNVNI